MPLGDIYLSDEFEPQFGLPWRPVLSRERLEQMTTAELAEYVKVRKSCEDMAEKNPVGAGWTLPMWELVMRNWKKYQIQVILGGNRCVRADTLIYDPVLNVHRRIDSIKGKHHVIAFDGTNLVIAEAEQPFKKGRGSMVRVELECGDSFVCAPEHQVLCADGSWRSVSKLRPESLLFRPATKKGIFPPGHIQDAQRSCEKASGSPVDCRPSRHLRDEQPRLRPDNAQVLVPSLADVPTRSGLLCNTCRWLFRLYARWSVGKSDAPDSTRGRNRALSGSLLLSTPDALCQLAAPFAGILYRVFYKLCKSAWASRGDQGFAAVHRQSIDACVRWQSSQQFPGRDMGFYRELASVKSLSWEEIDVKWDMTVPAYANYMAAGVIHHNSSKSVFASRMAVWAAATIPQAEVRCYHVNEDRSVEDQQRMIYDALPLGIRSIPTKKGIAHSLQYSQKNGFTDNICILPPRPGFRRGGSIKFGNYRQYQQDAQVAEGFKSHFIWGDEEMPQKFFETLIYRTVDYHGRIMLTFTTLTGWTPLIQDILGKTRTLEKRFAPLIGREVPIMQESLSRPGAAIYYFHTADNAFIDTTDFLDKIKGRPKDEVLARAYGIPTKSISGVFSLFNKEINVIEHEKLPWIKNPAYKVTRYMAIDPGGSKNWFMAWVAIDAAGTWWVYREWPDYEDWALSGNTAEGKPGPAQKGSGKGIKDYVELIRSSEDGEEIYERYIDPRMGAAEKQSEEGATTIISDLDDQNMTVIPAPGVDIENGIQLLNNLLAWDENKPRNSTNAPKLYVSDRCQNIIYALQEYTGKGGRNENTKDPIDVLRYIAVSNPEFYDKLDMQERGPTGCY